MWRSILKKLNKQTNTQTKAPKAQKFPHDPWPTPKELVFSYHKKNRKVCLPVNIWCACCLTKAMPCFHLLHILFLTSMRDLQRSSSEVGYSRSKHVTQNSPRAALCHSNVLGREYIHLKRILIVYTSMKKLFGNSWSRLVDRRTIIWLTNLAKMNNCINENM